MSDVIIDSNYYKQYLYHCEKNKCLTCKYDYDVVDLCFEVFLLKHNLVQFTEPNTSYFLKIDDEEVEYINSDNNLYRIHCDNTVDILLMKRQISDANNLTQRLAITDPYNITNIAADIIKRRIIRNSQNITNILITKIIINDNLRIDIFNKDRKRERTKRGRR